MKCNQVGKRTKIAFIFRLSAFLLFFASQFLPAFYFQERPREDVTVTAVEVPVRVLRSGQVVKGLTKEDFEVYENSLKQQILGFEIVSRQIAASTSSTQMETIQQPKPRLFILIFDIFNYNDTVGEAIDYFFKTIFRERDQLVILTEGRLFILDQGENPESIEADLKQTLKKYKVISTQNIYRSYLELKEECDRLLDTIGENPVFSPTDWELAAFRFYENYAIIWKDYRDRFLVPDIDVYQALVKRIKPIKADKWAICFKQRELFPELKSQGRLESRINLALDGKIDPEEQVKAQLVKSKQWQLKELMNTSKKFQSDRLKNLFMEAGITFHLILMKVPKTLLSEDLELREVAEDYEECFREISRSTGGYLTFSNKALDALKEAAEKEDYHYVLAYQSRAPLERRGNNIEVKVRQIGVKVYNLKQIQKLGGPAITIVDVQANRMTLSFGLKNYTMITTEKGPAGTVEVKIMLFNDKSDRIFFEGKLFELEKKDVSCSLNLDKLVHGSYFLIIEAQDRVTNEKDVYSRMIEIQRP